MVWNLLPRGPQAGCGFEPPISPSRVPPSGGLSGSPALGLCSVVLLMLPLLCFSPEKWSPPKPENQWPAFNRQNYDGRNPDSARHCMGRWTLYYSQHPHGETVGSWEPGSWGGQAQMSVSGESVLAAWPRPGLRLALPPWAHTFFWRVKRSSSSWALFRSSSNASFALFFSCVMLSSKAWKSWLLFNRHSYHGRNQDSGPGTSQINSFTSQHTTNPWKTVDSISRA